MRCGDLDAVNTIKDAQDALSAKPLGDKIKPNEQWNNTKFKVMEEVVENKCVQISMFKEKLRSAKCSTTFVETTYSDEWGSGLDRTGTINTKREHWPGQNVLGVIIGRVAKKVRKRKKSDQWSKAKQLPNFKESTKQRDISKMLRDIRTASETDSASAFVGDSDSDSYSE